MEADVCYSALFIGSLATHSVMLHRHRKAGLHCTPGVHGSNELKQQAYTTAVPAQQAYAVPASGYQSGAYQQA
jgi:hypothetical protein